MKPRDGLAVEGTTAVTTLLTSNPVLARQRHITSEILVWNGITVQVSYEADWLGLAFSGSGFPYSHLELHVLEPNGAPLPVTDTGYWSEFLALGEAEELGGPKAAAECILNELSNSTRWRAAWAKWEQRDLFA